MLSSPSIESSHSSHPAHTLGSDLCSLLRQGVQLYPDKTAVLYQGAEYSYFTLALATHHLQRQFAAQGITRGTMVGITLPSSPVFLATVFALAALGACVLPLSPSRPPQQRAQLANKYRIQKLLVNHASQALEGLHVLVLADLNIDAEEAQRFQQSAPAQPDASLADAPWFVALSSGTSESPKGVALTQAQSLIRVEQSLLTWDANTRTIPFDLSMGAGIFPALRTLAHGGTLLFIENADFDNDFASYVNRHQATHILLSPWMAAKLIQQLHGRKLAMPSLQYLWLGGGHCSSEVLQGLLDRATLNVWVKYASVETGVIAGVHAKDALLNPGLSGKLGPWVQARVQDVDGSVLAEGQSGLLSFRSAGWPSRYAVDEDNAAGAFSGGWYCSEDIGRLGADRSIYVEGRAGGALNFGGIRIQPEFVEEALAKQLNILDCAATEQRQADGNVHLIIAICAADSAKQAQILALLDQLLPSSQRIVKQVAVVAQILRTGMGKVARQQMRVLLEKA